MNVLGEGIFGYKLVIICWSSNFVIGEVVGVYGCFCDFVDIIGDIV